MVLVQKNVKIFLETKTINKGIYKNKPVYGDDVVPIANSFERVAKIFYIFNCNIDFICSSTIHKLVMPRKTRIT